MPTIGRPCLRRLLDTLAAQHAARHRRRPGRRRRRPRRTGGPSRAATSPTLPLPGAGAAPARPRARRRPATSAGGRSRRRGWRSSTTTSSCPTGLGRPAGRRPGRLPARRSAAVQGRIAGAAAGRPPADRLGAQHRRAAVGRWVTADMAYRRAALVAVGGFDERFPRAYREDADLALRVRRRRLDAGPAGRAHDRAPGAARPAAGSACALQRGQRRRRPDAAAARAATGGERAGTGRGPLPPARRRPSPRPAGVAGARRRRAGAPCAARRRGAWLAADRGVPCGADRSRPAVHPGRRRPSRDAWSLTSAAHPARRASATGCAARWRAPARPAAVAAAGCARCSSTGTARSSTTCPYNGDPALVRPVAGARGRRRRLRGRGLPVGVVSNQSGVGRGLLTADQVAR